MAKRKLPTSAITASEISELRAAILRRPPPIGDWVDMEYVLQIDPGLARQITAIRLETQSEVFKVMAEGAGKAAKLVSK
jgi:hypothetical protein